MKKTSNVIISALVTLTMVGCGEAKKTNPDQHQTIAVSIEPLRQIVEAIAGDDYNIITVLDKGANPETFEPSMAQRAATDKSELYFTVSAFPFENAIIRSSSGKIKAIDATQGIKRLYGTHSHGDGHSCEHEADPHTWTSVKNAVTITRNITKALIEQNPVHSDLYKSKRDSLLDVINNLDLRIEAMIDSATSKSFVIWHPSLSYIANDYGLTQIAVGEESKEISPRRLKEIIETAESAGAKVFFFQKEFDSRQANSLNEQLKARMVTIDPLAYDWMNQLETIANEIAK